MTNDNETKVSDVYFADPNEMILPDGFDPNDENFDLETFVAEDTPAEETPTTAESPAETDESVPEQQAPEQAPTTDAAQPDTQSGESVPPVEQTSPPEAVVPPVPQTIKVKFNHEERDLSFDEAATLAQKGLNYDKLQQKVTDLEAASTRGLRVAKMLGYQTVAEMLDAAETNYVEKEVAALVDQGNTEAMARFLVDQSMKQKAASLAQPAQQSAAPEEAQAPSAPAKEAPPAPSTMTPEREAEIREFVHAHPGVTVLPDEVIRMNRNGVRLLVAYERFQNQAALNELAILKQNQAAAAKAPVSGVTGRPGVSPKQDDDPFIKGFDSDPWTR